MPISSAKIPPCVDHQEPAVRGKRRNGGKTHVREVKAQLEHCRTRQEKGRGKTHQREVKVQLEHCRSHAIYVYTASQRTSDSANHKGAFRHA